MQLLQIARRFQSGDGFSALPKMNVVDVTMALCCSLEDYEFRRRCVVAYFCQFSKKWMVTFLPADYRSLIRYTSIGEEYGIVVGTTAFFLIAGCSKFLSPRALVPFRYAIADTRILYIQSLRFATVFQDTGDLIKSDFVTYRSYLHFIP